jgi:hypothetical protein
MVESLRALLGGIIDYAGMYPPAELPLSEALRNYIKYKQGREAWIVNRFVCPANRISELEAGLKWHGYTDRFGLCVVGRGGADAADFLANTLADIKSANKVDRAFFDIFETRLPPQLLGSSELGHLILRITRSLQEDTSLCLEVPMSETWKTDVPRAIEAISKHKSVSAKIRTGGVTRGAFPSSEQVALFIIECVQHNVSFKATAGLHHPVRKFDSEIGATMHGFLNVFLAAAVAYCFHADRHDLIPILDATDPSDFRCLTNRISVGTWHLSTKQLRAARSFATNFGSCSVSEPLGDLAHIGYSVRSAV